MQPRGFAYSCPWLLTAAMAELSRDAAKTTYYLPLTEDVCRRSMWAPMAEGLAATIADSARAASSHLGLRLILFRERDRVSRRSALPSLGPEMQGDRKGKHPREAASGNI